MRDPQAGVFEDLVDDAAFIDRVKIGIEGTPRQKPLAAITVDASFPIGGIDRPYARAVNGVCLRTGNPFQVRYGANPRFPNLSSEVLDLRSVNCPLTVEECDIVLGGLFRSGFRGRVAYLEWTCDASGISVDYLRDHYNSRATYFRELTDSLGFRTVYIGSPNSPWQLKIYDKANGIVRIEFALRAPFLRGRSIVQPLNIGDLRAMDSAALVRFCDLQVRPSKQAVAHIWKRWVQDLLVDWPRYRSLQTWATLMRGWKVNSAPYLADASIQRRLRGMHGRLVW